MAERFIHDIDLHGAGLKTAECFAIGGYFRGRQFRNGELISDDPGKNVVTDQGLNHALNVIFNGQTPVGIWYIGLFINNYTPVAGDTAATFPANAGEATTQYSEGSRQTYVEAASTAKSIANTGNEATFTATADVIVYGAFLASLATKGGTSGILMAAAKFATPKSLEVGDKLKVEYVINGSSL